MKVTKITPAAKTAGRYNIYVDDEYSFSLTESQLVQYSIHSGLDLDHVQLTELQASSEFGKNYLRAIDLISRRLRSEKEIRDYGYKKNWSQANLGRVIARLYDRGYLNDQAYATAFVRSRVNSNRYSKRRIEMDLRRKGIDNQIIQQVVNDNVNDAEVLIKLVKKRGPLYNEPTKLKTYLLRAGFNYSDINQAVADYQENS